MCVGVRTQHDAARTFTRTGSFHHTQSPREYTVRAYVRILLTLRTALESPALVGIRVLSRSKKNARMPSDGVVCLMLDAVTVAAVANLLGAMSYCHALLLLVEEESREERKWYGNGTTEH